MAFDHLLFESLQAGTFRADDRDSGCRTAAELKPEGGETVLLFRLDDKATRTRLGLGENRKCRDHVFFIKREDKCMLLFVELKSSDTADAEEQILHAYRAIRDKCDHVASGRVTKFGVIVSTRSSPGGEKTRKKAVKRVEGVELHRVTPDGGLPYNLRLLLSDRKA